MLSSPLEASCRNIAISLKMSNRISLYAETWSLANPVRKVEFTLLHLIAKADEHSLLDSLNCSTNCQRKLFPPYPKLYLSDSKFWQNEAHISGGWQP
jgi:hypothetical protein